MSDGVELPRGRMSQMRRRCQVYSVESIEDPINCQDSSRNFSCTPWKYAVVLSYYITWKENIVVTKQLRTRYWSPSRGKKQWLSQRSKSLSRFGLWVCLACCCFFLFCSVCFHHFLFYRERHEESITLCLNVEVDDLRSKKSEWKTVAARIAVEEGNVSGGSFRLEFMGDLNCRYLIWCILCRNQYHFENFDASSAAIQCYLESCRIGWICLGH